MKIRHKDPAWRLQYEAIDESATYWITPNTAPGGFRLALPKSDYEPVPEPRDVTAEVEIRERWNGNKVNPAISEAGVFHNGKRLAVLCCGGEYELKKVKRYLLNSDEHVGDAFIIEKKAPA